MEKKAANTAKPRKVPGQVNVHMKIDEKNVWDFKVENACDAIEEGQRICRDNSLKWEDVQDFDFS
jgi:hypothetical protein